MSFKVKTLLPTFLAGTSVGYFVNFFQNVENKKEIPLEEPKEIKKTLKETLKETYGLPSEENVKEYENFLSSRNYQKKIPNWVFQSLKKEDFEEHENQSDRKYSQFNNHTPEVPEIFRASNSDYLKSGYSRGHMVPASDMKYKSQNAMNETFLLNSNIVPQEYNNNANFWYRIEVFVRKNLVNSFKTVNVISGPAFIPNIIEDEKHFMKYQILGKNQVAVPNYLFKSILVETNDGKYLLSNFLIPNEPIPKDKTLLDFEESKENLEKSTGLKLYDNIQLDGRLCEHFDCKSMMTELQLEQWNFSRRIEWSKTKQEVEEIWKEIEDKGYKPDKLAKDAYKKKLKEFE
jgi:DNA/RNA endonuclease G (NUC1)